MDALQRAIPGPQVEIGPHCALRRQVFGQRLPLAACPKHVENSVQNLAHVDRALAAALLSRWHHGLDNRPFGASQITRITKTAAVRSNAMFRLPHRALPLANQTPNIESQPIHQTQQLPGSALRPSFASERNTLTRGTLFPSAPNQMRWSSISSFSLDSVTDQQRLGGG